MFDVEVDQSGRIEVLTKDTIIGVSNGAQLSVLIPAQVKRAVTEVLRSREVKPKMISLRLFAGGVFLALENIKDEVDRVVIDVEFPGREGEIRGLLLKLIQRRYPEFGKERILFRHITKKSRAHNVAITTYRRKRRPDRVVTYAELLAVCL